MDRKIANKEKIRFIQIVIICLFVIISFKYTVNASYSIENMDIQATIQDNGDLKVEQDITYKFNSSYNGIYVTIPYSLNDVEAKNVLEGSRINDNFYTGNNVVINDVSVSTGQDYNSFKRTNYASNGDNGVYTIVREGNLEKIKVYSPSQYIEKNFKLKYIIQNVCVKHNDVGELYYNFIGGAWDVR